MLRRFALVAAALAAVPFGISWIVSQTVLHPKPRKEDHSLDDFDLPAEDASFPSRDGIRLSGWFIPASSGGPAPAVVLAHGWARSRAELLPHADFLHRAGFAVFAFDQRHRGLSEGAEVTFGVREQDDLLGALDVVSARPEVDAERIAVLGMSTGAVVAIVVASRDTRVRTIVAECPYRSPEAILSRAIRHYSHLPGFLFSKLAKRVIELRLRRSLDSANAGASVAKLTPRRIFIIGDERDALIGANETACVFEAAAEPKRFWMVPGAGHARGWQAAPREYEQRVIAFLREALAVSDAASPAPALARENGNL